MKRLLVALDGSPRALDVLKAAVVQAQATGAELVLLRAVGIPSDLPFTGTALSPADVLSILEQRAKEELNELARDLIPKGLAWVTRVETSAAWAAICQTARAIEANLIVIGAHGYGALDRLLGTTAARVVNHADRSVLVVRSLESTSNDAVTKGRH